MIATVASSLLAAALVVFRPLAVPAPPAAPTPPRAEYAAACDDGTNGGSLVQRSDTWYGNRLGLPCAAGRLRAVEFTYVGAGLAGPYAFRLHVLDAECHELAVSSVLEVPGAPDVPALAAIDVTSLGACVSSGFAILLEPLSCADGAAAHDCMPALVVDASSDTQEAAHCGLLNASTLDGRQCLAPRSSDGRFFDFRLRAQVDCGAPECTTATVPADWSRVKRLYQ